MYITNNTDYQAPTLSAGSKYHILPWIQIICNFLPPYWIQTNTSPTQRQTSQGQKVKMMSVVSKPRLFGWVYLERSRDPCELALSYQPLPSINQISMSKHPFTQCINSQFDRTGYIFYESLVPFGKLCHQVKLQVMGSSIAQLCRVRGPWQGHSVLQFYFCDC